MNAKQNQDRDRLVGILRRLASTLEANRKCDYEIVVDYDDNDDDGTEIQSTIEDAEDLFYALASDTDEPFNPESFVISLKIPISYGRIVREFEQEDRVELEDA